MTWKTGNPPKSGYYLIAWVNPSLTRHISVSEAWFNPDAVKPWWWSRGYTGERSRGMEAAINHEIVAWMPMPDPPIQV